MVIIAVRYLRSLTGRLFMLLWRRGVSGFGGWLRVAVAVGLTGRLFMFTVALPRLGIRLDWWNGVNGMGARICGAGG